MFLLLHSPSGLVNDREKMKVVHVIAGRNFDLDLVINASTATSTDYGQALSSAQVCGNVGHRTGFPALVSIFDKNIYASESQRCSPAGLTAEPFNKPDPFKGH